MKPLRIAQIFFAASLVTVALSQTLLASRHYVPEGDLHLDTKLRAPMPHWKEVPTAQEVVDPSDSGAQDSADQLYDKVEYHTFRRADGVQVLLTLAYRRVQEQESKIHRPELCYFAQGFVISSPLRAAIAVNGTTLPALTFQARSAQHSETVVYWIRIGDSISTSAWQTRLHLVSLGLHQWVPDGLLVRASIVAQPDVKPKDVQANVATIVQFLGELVKSADADNRRFLAGGA